MKIESYSAHNAARWDEFAGRCVNATFLHTRRFLGYHEDRFRDRSLLVLKPDSTLAGLLPAAEDPVDPAQIVSHPGATFGGLAHDGALHGAEVLRALVAALEHYRGLGAHRLVYKAVPALYHRSPAEDDLYALFRLGARRARCGLSSTVELTADREWSSRRRRGLAKARRAGLEVVSTPDALDGFWPLLETVLRERHGVLPVHSAPQMRRLMTLFPEEIELVVARQEGRTLAGTVLFHSHSATHAQYIASGPEGRQAGALDLVFETCTRSARTRGARYFDFGISTERGGEVLNEGLETFKHEYGAGSTVYETYELDL